VRDRSANRRSAGLGGAGNRLDPVRWPRLPGTTLALRALVVTALLVTAAGAMYTGDRSADARGCGTPLSRTTTAPAARSGAPTAGSGAPTTGSGAPAIRSGAPASDNGAQTGTGTPPDRLALPAGRVGVPVRLAEPATAEVLRAGDRVDLLAVASSGATTTVGTDALVLAVGPASPGYDGMPATGSAMIVLALTPTDAKRAVGSEPGTRLAVIVRP
jgi:hypothetical protein